MRQASSTPATEPGPQSLRERYADRIQARIARHVPNLESSILDRVALSPADLRRRTSTSSAATRTAARSRSTRTSSGAAASHRAPHAGRRRLAHRRVDPSRAGARRRPGRARRAAPARAAVHEAHGQPPARHGLGSAHDRASDPGARGPRRGAPDRYARIDTQSDKHSTAFPSTEKQWDLLWLLRDELVALGLADVDLTSRAISSRRCPRPWRTTCRRSGFSRSTRRLTSRARTSSRSASATRAARSCFPATSGR